MTGEMFHHNSKMIDLAIGLGFEITPIENEFVLLKPHLI